MGPDRKGNGQLQYQPRAGKAGVDVLRTFLLQYHRKTNQMLNTGESTRRYRAIMAVLDRQTSE
jgi:hypothetical protein